MTGLRLKPRLRAAGQESSVNGPAHALNKDVSATNTQTDVPTTAQWPRRKEVDHACPREGRSSATGQCLCVIPGTEVLRSLVSRAQRDCDRESTK